MISGHTDFLRGEFHPARVQTCENVIQTRVIICRRILLYKCRVNDGGIQLPSVGLLEGLVCAPFKGIVNVGKAEDFLPIFSKWSAAMPVAEELKRQSPSISSAPPRPLSHPPAPFLRVPDLTLVAD